MEYVSPPPHPAFAESKVESGGWWGPAGIVLLQWPSIWSERSLKIVFWLPWQNFFSPPRGMLANRHYLRSGVFTLLHCNYLRMTGRINQSGMLISLLRSPRNRWLKNMQINAEWKRAALPILITIRCTGSASPLPRRVTTLAASSLSLSLSLVKITALKLRALC